MNRLRELRELKGLSLRELSSHIDIDYSHISKIERNEVGLSENSIKILSDFFGVTADYLLGYDRADENGNCNILPNECLVKSNNRLRELRMEKGLSLREFAEKMNCSYSNIATIERGEGSLTEANIKLFSDFFGVSSDYLLGLTNEKIKVYNNRIRELRKEKGLTLRELSDKMHIDNSNLSKIERGDLGITADNLIAFAKYFEVTTDYLLGVSETRKNTNEILERKLNELDVQIMYEIAKMNDEEKQDVITLLNILKKRTAK